MRTLLALVALLAGTAFVQAQEAERSTALDIEQLSGWWRYEHTDWGCSDTEDNQYRAALGRYTVVDGKFTFGIGDLGLGFYDGGCDLFDPVMRDGKLELVAICGAEGEHFNGRATLERTGPDRLSLHSPVMNTTLVACPADTPHAEAETPPVDRTLEQFGLGDTASLNPTGKDQQVQSFSETPSPAEQQPALAVNELSPEDFKQMQAVFGGSPRFTSVSPGTQGTRFRGVALGQFKEEVESALEAIGLRCLRAEELRPILASKVPIETLQGYETCRITRGEPTGASLEELAFQMDIELQYTHFSMNSIAFLDGRAAALCFESGFFNAAASTPYAFASAIAEHYPLPSGLDPITNGWKGMSSNNEIFFVTSAIISYQPVNFLTVIAATASNTPAFD